MSNKQKGSNAERELVKLFTSHGWRAVRVAGSGVGEDSPCDLIAAKAKRKGFTIEAKSGTSTSLPVPADQIERCMSWIKTFDVYKEKNVILAFKFLSKKRIGIGKYESRELREFFKIWDNELDITNCVCSYDGKIFVKKNGVKEELHLKECIMPFKTKQRSSAKLK